jgi:ankyrin repeat protein
MKTNEQLMEEMLFEAIEENNREEAKGLIALGVDVNAKDENLKTPLHLAAALNRLTIADALIEAGADVDAKDALSKTPIEFVPNGCTQMREMLRKAKNGLVEHQEEKIKKQIREEIRKKMKALKAS